MERFVGGDPDRDAERTAQYFRLREEINRLELSRRMTDSRGQG
jgi:hypothetical protein